MVWASWPPWERLQRGLKHPETLEDRCELEGVTLRKATLVEARNHAHTLL